MNLLVEEQIILVSNIIEEPSCFKAEKGNLSKKLTEAIQKAYAYRAEIIAIQEVAGDLIIKLEFENESEESIFDSKFEYKYIQIIQASKYFDNNIEENIIINLKSAISALKSNNLFANHEKSKKIIQLLEENYENLNAVFRTEIW